MDLQVTIFTLNLTSPTLPPGKTISFNLANPDPQLGKERIAIKEGVEYSSVPIKYHIMKIQP
jgi:hypothetical protein